jgi:uncharacterized protein (TIGR02246 family)
MSRTVKGLVVFVSIALFMIACGEPAANNAGNRAANAANNSAANSASSGATAEADVRKVLTDLAAALAKNDADAAGRFYSDDYHLITLEGKDQTKAERIAEMRSSTTKFDSFSYDDPKIRAYGDTAVVITNVKTSGTLHGKPSQSPTLIATLVLRKMPDGWKVVTGQATPVTASAAPANSGTNSTANGNENGTANSAANTPAANR